MPNRPSPVRPNGSDPPASIGPYRLIERIGTGGMGTVWLAEQAEPVRRQVALKLVRADLDGEELLQRFDAERRLVALMSHPNIAQIYDAGRSAEGLPYFAMEYVPGLPLTEFCDRRELDLAARLRLFVDVCRGVHHAHQKGVLHRDLKPSNVLVQLLDDRPVPKIIDFGVAKVMQPALAGTQTFAERGRFLGTPSYMSPEQADPTALGIDSRTDVYSLGVLLYELLVGETPFDARKLSASELADLPRKIREQTPSRPSRRIKTAHESAAGRAASRAMSPRRLARSVGGDLDWITLKALQKDPEKRYASASELALDVERYLSGRPVAAAPHGPGYIASKFLRRHRVSAIATLAVIVSLVAGLTVALRLYREARANEIAAKESEGRAERNEQEARSALARALEAEADARASLERERAALSEATGRRLAAQSLNLAEEDPTLALLLAVEGAERNPGEETSAALYRALERHREIARFDGHDGPVAGVAVSPDEQWILSGESTGLVLLFDLASGEIRARLDEHMDLVSRCGFLPDGRRAWSTSFDGTAIVWDLDGFAPLARLSVGSRIQDAVLCGRSLCTSSEDGLVRAFDVEALGEPRSPTGIAVLVDAPSGAELARYGSGEEACIAAAISPDGRLAFVAFEVSERRRGEILEVPGGRQVATLRGRDLTDNRCSASFAPDNATLIVSMRGHEQWDVATGNWRGRFVGAPHGDYRPVFLRDGQRIVAGGHDSRVRIWRTSALREDRRLAAMRAQSEIDDFVLSPDGELSVVMRGQSSHVRTCELVDAPSGRRLFELLPPRPGGIWACFSSDCSRLALAHESLGLRVWELAARRIAFERAGEYRTPQLSGNGRWLSVHVGDAREVFDARSGKLLGSITVPGAQTVEPSPDGLRVLCAEGSHNAASVRELATGEVLTRVRHSGFVFYACFDPEGRRFATYANDTTASVWGPGGEQLVTATRIPVSDFGAIEWSRDGRLLLVANEKDLLLFDADTGAGVARWKAGTDAIHYEQAGFLVGGRYLLDCRASGFARFLPLDPLAEARTLLPRRLASIEMETYDIGTKEEREARDDEERAAERSAALLGREAAARVKRGEFAVPLEALARARELRKHPSPSMELTYARALALRPRGRIRRARRNRSRRTSATRSRRCSGCAQPASWSRTTWRVTGHQT